MHLLALEHGAVHLPQACGSQGGLLKRIEELVDGLAKLLLDDLDRLFWVQDSVLLTPRSRLQGLGSRV